MTKLSWFLSLLMLVGCGVNFFLKSTPTSQSQDSIEIEMVQIPAGTFTMGSETRESPSEGPPSTPHEVTLTTPFYLGIYEVTNQQYDLVMGPNARYGHKGGPDQPVTMVSWENAVKFCKKLSELPASKSAGKVYRLPTEAEWEYACRAGSSTAYCFGDSPLELGEYAWFSDNYRDRAGFNETKPVGTKKPNAWGLYDMHGNLNEYCQDFMGDYPVGPVTDPRGPRDGHNRVVRGGDWGDSANRCSSTFRNAIGGTSNSTGFRVAMNLSSQLKPTKSVEQVPLADFDRSSQLDHQPRFVPLKPLLKLDYDAMKKSFWHIAALLANGADPNAKSDDGTPILFHAIDDSDIEIKTITSNWNVEDDQRRMSKLPPRIRSEAIPKRLESLLQAGADPNLCNQNGQSPLHYAFVNHRWEALKYLYKYGADPNKPDASGLTVIEFGSKSDADNIRSGVAPLKQPLSETKVGKPIVPPQTLRKPDLVLGSTLFRPSAGGKAITFSADGKQIIAGETESVLRVFDAATGARVSVIRTSWDDRFNHYIWSLTTIPKSRIVIASGGIGYPLRFWNIDTGIEVMRLACQCIHASVSPDGKYLFTGDYLCQIDSVDPLKLAPTARQFRGTFDQKIQVRSSFFTPDSRYLVFVDDEYVRVWDLVNDEVSHINGLNPKALRPITWGDLAATIKLDMAQPSQDIIALPGNGVGFLVGNSQVLKANQSLIAKHTKTKTQSACALSLDNQRLAALGSASRIDVFDLPSQKPHIQYTAHTDAVLAVAVSPDGKFIASGGQDRKVILWESASGKMMRSIPANARIRSLCFTADSSHLAIGDESGVLHQHDVVRDATKTWTCTGAVTGLQYDESRDAFILLCNNLELRKAASGKLLSSLPAASAKSGYIAYAQAGLILGSVMPYAENIKSRNAWSISGDKLVPEPRAFGASNDEIGDRLTTYAISISRDGKLGATENPWGGLQLWNLEKKEAITPAAYTSFRGNVLGIFDVEFSLDGQYVAAGCQDGTARIWDVATGQQLLILDADCGAITDIAFHPNGKLVTANRDGTVHVWAIPKKP